MKKITPILTHREYLADMFARARAAMDTLSDEQCAVLASGLHDFLASAKPVPMTAKELSLFISSAFAEHGERLVSSIRAVPNEPPPFKPCARTLARVSLRLPVNMPDHPGETCDDYDYRAGWNTYRTEVCHVLESLMNDAGV